jgi:hypothetical protein
MDLVGVRIQGLPLVDQVLTMARLAELRSDTGLIAPLDLDHLFDEVGLPQPAKTSNVLASLERKGLMTRSSVAAKGRSWQLTPWGRQQSLATATDMDLAALVAEGRHRSFSSLGDTPHPVIPPSLAPPELVKPLHGFFREFPFEKNLFAMTRFPDPDPRSKTDPLAPALAICREVCADHGLTLHLASDRQIVDGLWANVAAHIWGCQFGLAFFEDRTGKGLNYNLNIEVGSCLVLGRRLAILKDSKPKRSGTALEMPTDLVGHIYKTVDLGADEGVRGTLHRWIDHDLGLGPCSRCAHRKD